MAPTLSPSGTPQPLESAPSALEPWQVSDETIAWLAEAQRTRPRPTSFGTAFVSVIAVIVLLTSVSIMTSRGASLMMVAWSALSLAWLGWLVVRDAKWRRQYRPRTLPTNRMRILAPKSSPRAPQLSYTMPRSSTRKQAVLADFHIVEDFHIEPGLPALLLPDFDADLGVRGSALVRALIGSELAGRLVGWWNRLDVTVSAGAVQVPVTPGKGNFGTLQIVCAPFGALADRLADPTSALAELARTDTLFHAALAWCVLRERVADAPQLLSADTDPERATLLRRIDAGEQPFELPVGWSERAEIFRGMLSSLKPRARHRSVLCKRLLKQVPTDAMSAMGLLDMLDAANTHARLRGADPLHKRIAGCLVEQGDAHTISWLKRRATVPRLLRHSDALIGRIKARLHAEQAGRLALSGDPIQGALSDARAGEVSLADEG